MDKLRVTLAQIPVYNEIQKNCAVIKEAIQTAGKDHSDILLTPEGSLSGYTHLFNREEANDALAEVTAYAKERKIGLALGTCLFESDGKCYDELRFYLPDGTYLGCHTKTLLCGTIDEEPKGEIEFYAVMPLSVFDFNGITVGGLVCNDMWANPGCTPMADLHLTHLLKKKGAKVIFHSVNGGRDAGAFSQETVKTFHEMHLIMKARADGMFIATVDNAFPLDIGVSSYGGVVSPEGWLFKLPDMGVRVDSFTIELNYVQSTENETQ